MKVSLLKPILGVLSIALVFFGTTAFCFTKNPASWFDEGIYHQIAKNMATVGVSGFQTAPGVYADFALISVGFSVFYPAAVVLRLVGTSIVVLRLVASFFVLATIILVYLLAKKLYGPRAAWWSALLLSLFSPLYGNGKNFLGEVPGIAYCLLGLYLFVLYEEKVARKYLAGSAIAFGLAIAAKPIYLLVAPALLGAVLVRARWQVESIAKIKNLLWAAIVGAAVLVVWLVTQFGPSTMSFARIFAHYKNPNDVSGGVGIVATNILRFVTEWTPLHFAFLAGLLVVALFWKRKEKSVGRSVEIFIFLFSLLVTFSYIRTAGWYRYFFPAHLLLFITAPAALDTIFLKFFRNNTVKAATASCVLLACVVAAQLGPFYSERLVCRPDAPTVFEQIFTKIKGTDRVLFYSVPQIAARYQTQNFYQYIEMNPALHFGDENIGLLGVRYFDKVYVESARAGIVPICGYIKTYEGAGLREYAKTTEVCPGEKTRTGSK